jgi:hypothetical protein
MNKGEIQETHHSGDDQGRWRGMQPDLLDCLVRDNQNNNVQQPGDYQ